MFGSQRTRKGARGARAFLFARLERLRFAFRVDLGRLGPCGLWLRPSRRLLAVVRRPSRPTPIRSLNHI